MRNGVMFPCENTMEHGWLASRIHPTASNPEKKMEDEGCIKVALTKSFGPISGGIYILASRKPSQKQIDAIFQWGEQKPEREKHVRDFIQLWDRE